jgi:heat shock protein HtpX
MDRRLLDALGAEPLADSEQPRLVNMVDGLCVANGFRRPDLYVVDDTAPNMAVIGRHPTASALVITRGAIEQLGRIELEGSIAHELARMRSRAPLAEATVATLGPIVGVVPPLRSMLVHHLLDPRTTVERDVEGVTLTRYPPGLARALEAIRADGRQPARSPHWMSHMWLVPPPDAPGDPEFDLEARIAVLDEL